MKYNMIDKEFNSFVRKVVVVLVVGDEKDWNFVNSCGFVFFVIIIIGKI